MREEKRRKRQQEIEAAAYRLIGEKGYDGMSMLAVARAARASNETLYNWYGDKLGLFQAMVTTNADEIRTQLEDLGPGNDPVQALEKIAPKLLTMLTGERAIALNRAAAADPTGQLGKALAQNGRSLVMPMIRNLIAAASGAGLISVRSPDEAVEWFLALLIGDLQVRRVTGALEMLSPEEISARSAKAMTAFALLVGKPERS